MIFQSIQKFKPKSIITIYLAIKIKVKITCRTKSRPRKSAIDLGKRVRPHTNLKKRDRSEFPNSSITSQNQMTSGELASTPLYVATDFNRCKGMSGLPHTMVSNSNPVKSDKSGTGTTRDMPSRTAEAAGSNS